MVRLPVILSVNETRASKFCAAEGRDRAALSAACVSGFGKGKEGNTGGHEFNDSGSNVVSLN